MSAVVSAGQRKLRVAVVWNQSVLADDVLHKAAPVTLGPRGIVPVPASLAIDDLTLLAPRGPGYALVSNPNVGGEVWLNGRRTPVDSLTGEVPIGPSDHGVLLVGQLAIAFQHVRDALPPPRQASRADLGLIASVLLAAFLCGTLLVFGYLDSKRRLAVDPFELNEGLIRRFPRHRRRPKTFLPRSWRAAPKWKTPGFARGMTQGGERHEDEEGRVGHEESDREDTEIEGEVTDRIAAKVRTMGLLGALDGGGEGNAIAAALDVPTISDILGGTGASATRAGRGSRGAGLRGLGMGGGGTGPGSLFGAGDVGAGIGAGTGMGLGMGQGGIGAMGRERREVQISVMRGRPSVSGYLSPEQINRVVRANQAAVRYCYEVEVQRQPSLRGRVEIAWRINLQGSVTTARVASSSLRNPRVEGCIVRQVKRWRFPQPDGGEVRVQYPFIFGVQGG